VGNSSAAKAPPGRLPSPEGPIRSAPPPRNEPPKINPPKEDPPKSGEPKTEPPKVDPQVDLPDPKIDDDWPTLPPRKRPAERADAPSRTVARWYAPIGGGSPLLVLDRPDDPFPRGTFHRGPLARELARQSLLMSAREEFGATTRDTLLGELPGVRNNPVCTFELTSLVLPGKSATVALSVLDGAARREVW
jgi:hypothetical protein